MVTILHYNTQQEQVRFKFKFQVGQGAYLIAP